MQLRRLRIAALAGLPALVACAQDPNTHASFTAVVSTSTPDAAVTPPSDGGAGGSPNVDAGPRADGQSSGCGMDPGQNPNATYVEYHLSVSGPDLDANMQPIVRDRIYYVRLPTTYDETVPSRVVYLGPGCGGSTAADVLRLYSASMNDAILVAVIPLQTPPYNACFDETMNSVEYPFFDALHKKIESTLCVDTSRQFYAGFSTGARLGFMLDCAFPDVLRATATDQGALPSLPACNKHPIAAFFLADTQETGNPYQANVLASQRVAAQNGCTGTFQNATTFDPMTMGAAPATTACVKYTGCPTDYPVVFCTTMGQGHMTFEPWSDQAFWNFFSQF